MRSSKNIARSQMAASNTSHRLSRCQVFLNKRLLSEIILLNMIWVFKVCKNLSCWVLTQLELMNFVTVWVLEVCQTLIWIMSQCKLLSFVTIQVFEFCYHLFFEFWTIWVFLWFFFFCENCLFLLQKS